MRGGTFFGGGLARVLLLVAGWCLCGVPVWAHKVSDSYLRLRVEERQWTGQWFLALHDLEFALGLDGNEDGAITWGELKARREAVLAYASERLGIRGDGELVPVRFETAIEVDQLANGGYVVLRFAGEGPAGVRSVEIDYRVFFDSNRLHRGLVLLERGDEAQQAVFNPVETRLRFEFAAPRPWREFGHFLVEGVWHIWIGYDHILFLLALLLPSVLRREAGVWVPVDDLRGAALNVVKIVTAFTVAHSITLSLAALEVIRWPARVVEPVIAASIVVAALNNVRPVVTARTWGIAFGFGLIHGFGFASVLADLGLPKGSLVRALVGFNLGVELGQLAIVALFLPVAHGLRHRDLYRGLVLRWGSTGVAALAAWWMVQRLQGG